MVAPCFNKQAVVLSITSIIMPPSDEALSALAWPSAGMPLAVQHQCIVCAHVFLVFLIPPHPTPDHRHTQSKPSLLDPPNQESFINITTTPSRGSGRKAQIAKEMMQARARGT
jgi:hypothetical protein